MQSARRVTFAILAILINAVAAVLCMALIVTFIRIRERWVLDCLAYLFCSTLHLWYRPAETWGWKLIVVLPSAAVNVMVSLGTVLWVTGDSI